MNSFLYLILIIFINFYLYFLKNGATALHYAATKGKLQFLRELINHGSDVNIEDNVSNFQHYIESLN